MLELGNRVIEGLAGSEIMIYNSSEINVKYLSRMD